MILIPHLRLNSSELLSDATIYDASVTFGLALSSVIVRNIVIGASVTMSTSIAAGPANTTLKNASIALQSIRTATFAGTALFNALLQLDKSLQTAQQSNAISDSSIIFAKINVVNTSNGAVNEVEISLSINKDDSYSGTLSRNASIELSKLLEEITSANVVANANVILSKINAVDLISQCIAYASANIGYRISLTSNGTTTDIVIVTPSERTIKIRFENRTVTIRRT